MSILEHPTRLSIAPVATDGRRSGRGVEDAPEEQPPSTGAKVATALIVGIPIAALFASIVVLWGSGIHLRDLGIAVALYVLTGHGVTVGFHRLLAHKALTVNRPLKVVLVALGSMAYQGAPIGWVANHRRHHVLADTLTDPHSPQHHGRGPLGRVKGLWHAHVGWLFTYRGGCDRLAADLRTDPDLVRMNALFPMWCVVSLALPLALGWIVGGSFAAALGTFFWAGLVRVALLHHVTWSVNSLCHMFGRRPFSTRDTSHNLRVLAVISMGESWHNGHHAIPRSARHGLLRGQLDTSARLIRCFERVGWATEVRWPSSDDIGRRADTLASAHTAHQGESARGVVIGE